MSQLIAVLLKVFLSSAALDGGTEVMVFVYSFAVCLVLLIRCLGRLTIFVSRRSEEPEAK